MASVRLFSRFIVRALRREKIRSIVAAIGIASGVAVMMAIRLANVSVVETFRTAVNTVSGNASLRIRGVAGPFDEQLFRNLLPLREYGQLSPVMEAYAMVAEPPRADEQREGFPRGELLHVLGVDVLLDYPLREYHVVATSLANERSAREVLTLLNDPYSVILTEKFLRRTNRKVGETIPLVFGSQLRHYTIRGVLLDEGPARTLDGNFALMDIAAAQLATDRLGMLDYVDVLLDEYDEQLDDAMALEDIQKRLPAGLVAELPEAFSGRSQTMIAAFQFNLAALSGVALIVGLFLIYNTVAISVAARRTEIGLLKAAGSTRLTVLLLFLGEAMILATVGVALGLPAGRIMANQAVTATAQTVETFYIQGVAESSAAALRLSLSDVLTAAAIAIPLALLASLVPAWEAASTPPVEATRGLGTRMSPAKLRRLIYWSLLWGAGGYLMTFGKPIGGQPILGFAAELMFMIGGALLTPVVLWCVALAGGHAARWLPAGRIEARLAAANLLGALPRVSVSVAALAVSLSMMVAIAVMVGSFRETVVYWLNSALSADLAVKPVMQTSSVSEASLSTRAVEIIRADPDVQDTIWFSARQVAYRDTRIRLAATEMEKTLQHARLLIKSPQRTQSLMELREPDAVMVSESFALLFGARVGEQIELPAPAGPAQFTVKAIYYDYASNQGTVMMDVATFQRHFAVAHTSLRPQALSVFLRGGADPQVVRQRIVGALGANEQVYCVTNREVRREAMRIFESTFTITYALQLVAILIAGLGIAATLITLIYQRQRELGLLSLMGATCGQMRRVILWEAILLGAVSQLIGIGIGMVLALVLIYVINVQSFGWTIQLHLPLVFLLQSTVLVLLGSALFGLYPAVRAASANPLATVRQE